MNRRAVLAIAAFSCWACTVSARLAAQPVADPAAPIAALDSALVASMKAGKQAGFAARASLLAPVIDAAFDLPSILKSTVGSRWDGMKPDQQAALLKAFRGFTIASYAGNFDSYDGQTISIVPPPRAVGSDRIVQTSIVSSADTNRIDYQMRAADGGWKIRDVLLDGTISNVAVQRSDFRSLLAGGDPQKLIDRLNQKIADLTDGSAQ